MTKEGDGKNALITGASAGIGAALAAEFAQNGFNLVLVARREDRLHKIARGISESFGVQVHVITADLAKVDAPVRLFEELDRRHLVAHALVNNAGLGLGENFSDLSWSVVSEYIQLMGTNVVHLCHLAVPHMRRAGYGRILNVASVAAFYPGDAGSLYRALKAFVVHFSTSLDAENKEHNIRCTALCPGLTYTEFHDVMGTRQEYTRKFPKFLWMNAETVAKQGYKALMKGEKIYINGWFYKWTAKLAKTFS